MALMRHDTTKREMLAKPLDFFDRFFDDVSDVFRRPVLLWPTSGHEPMQIDEFTEDGTLVIKVDLPGIDPDKDVEISVSNDELHITAERREEEKTEGRDYVRRELHYGSYRRDLPLPKGSSDADLKASYKDGILEIRVPVAEVPAESTKKIPITKG